MTRIVSWKADYYIYSLEGFCIYGVVRPLDYSLLYYKKETCIASCKADYIYSLEGSCTYGAVDPLDYSLLSYMK